MRREKKMRYGLVIILLILLSQTFNVVTALQTEKHQAIIIRDINQDIKGPKSGNLPDITITRMDAWYVIEPINENESLITQNVLINVMNIGSKKTGGYSVNLTVFAIWSDHEEIVLITGLIMGVLGTEFNWHRSKINWPSLEKPLQYRAEVSTSLQEEESYENNIMTVPCFDGFRISGNVTLSILQRLILRRIPLVIFIEDVNPRYSINRTAWGWADRNGSINQYSFTAPVRETLLQVRAFLSLYSLLGFFFPNMKLPLLCLLTSKVTVIDPPKPNEHIWVDFQF